MEKGTTESPISILCPDDVVGCRNTTIHYKKLGSSWNYKSAEYCLANNIKLVQTGKQEREKWAL